MWEKIRVYSEIIKKYPSQLLMMGMFILSPGAAQALTADDVLNKMDSTQQHSFIAGVVGGFAYSRFLQDRPDKTGMKCIYDWYYGSGQTKWPRIETWFARHLDKPAEPLLYVLIKRECGE